MARAGAVLEIDRRDPPDFGQLLRWRPPSSDRRPLDERSYRRDEALLERGRRSPVDRTVCADDSRPPARARGGPASVAGLKGDPLWRRAPDIRTIHRVEPPLSGADHERAYDP